MNKATAYILLAALILAGRGVHAQYFQQQVDYTISITLDPQAHILRGQWEMVYSNNSPDTLHILYLHLYPNAYSSKSTAFAKQQLRLGLTDFHFAGEADLGRIDSLDFLSNDERIAWSLDKEHADIALLNLPQPLLPGKELHLKSGMRVKIPKAFSRMGYIDDSYQITQWYPKPAVYNQEGWHPLPYLNQGEYYAEFGSFEVDITVPESYIVAATGTLQTPEARSLLDSLASIKNSPASSASQISNTYRTWKYRAEDVHDFAWFADTRFAVRRKVIDIEGKEVECWAFFTDTQKELWESATDYLADAITFYSKHAGTYPYPQMTGVQVPLGKDFGMEYPMITSINMADSPKMLDDVLTHEVGHSWFYGALGNNEREYHWMDEGINTFYEFQYLREKYRDWSEYIIAYKRTDPKALSDEQRILQHMTRERQLVAPQTDPEFQAELQVFFGAYFKPALAFDMLKEYMGDEIFSQAMHDYFYTWKFKHPQPEDLRDILEAHCSCDLNWLFDGLLTTSQLIDYRVTGWKNDSLVIENKGEIDAPIHLIAYSGDSLLSEQWFQGFSGSKSIHVSALQADRIQIYDEVYTLDATPTNNVLFLKGARGSTGKFRVRMGGGKYYPGERYLNLLPLLGYNEADRLQTGLAISNTSWPPGKLQWIAVPYYSFHTESFTGIGEIQYRTFPKEGPRFIEFGLEGRTFHFAQDTHYGFFDRYVKIAPRIRIGVDDHFPTPPRTSYLQYRFVHVQQNYGRGINYEEKVWAKEERSYSVHELLYHRSNQQTLTSYAFETTLHAGQGFVRLFSDLNYRIAYRKPRKALYLHAFGGILPYYDEPKANVLFNLNGIQSNSFFSRDYLYDELLFARNATTGIESQYVFLKDAQVKTLYNGGLADKWMVAAGFSTSTPFPFPIQPYFDIALYNDPFEEGVAISYSGGLSFVIKKDVCEIFVPLIESNDIRESLTYINRDTIWRRISILLDLKALHPFKYKGY